MMGSNDCGVARNYVRFSFKLPTHYDVRALPVTLLINIIALALFCGGY